MTEHVETTWTLERETRNGKLYMQMELELKGEFSYSRAYQDDPGECQLVLESVTLDGESFELTTDEEKAIIAQWTEELRS